MAQGGDSTLYGVRNDTMFITGERFYLNGFEAKSFYVSDRKPKVVESFKHAGAYYELREDGWYKEIDTIPDYLNGDIRIKGDSVFRWAEEPKWCDQHIGTRDMPKRDKIDRTRAKIIVWNGCTMIELEAYKITHYNEMTVAKDVGNLAIYIAETIKVDIVTEYLYDGGWIKPSHVIKEL